SGAGKAVGGRCRIGDEAVYVGIDAAIGAVEAGALKVAGDQRSAQQIDAALEAPQIAAGARIGEGPIVVVDRLGEEGAPDRGLKLAVRRRYLRWWGYNFFPAYFRYP